MGNQGGAEELQRGHERRPRQLPRARDGRQVPAGGGRRPRRRETVRRGHIQGEGWLYYTVLHPMKNGLLPGWYHILNFACPLQYNCLGLAGMV